MRILVVGASGQVGKRIARRLQGRHEVIGTGFTRSTGWERLDLGDVEAVRMLVRRVRPEVILNPGGVTAVDWCEDHYEEALAANAAGPAALAETAREIGAYLVHLSTDFVFSGEKGPYSEEDPPDPISAYSATKLEGERRIQAVGGECSILRTAVIYSYEDGEKNFLMQVVRTLREGGTFRAFTDQHNSPTDADNLAEAVIEFGERRIPGLFHVAGAQIGTRYEVARKVVETFRLPEDRLIPIQTADLKLRARRPKNAGLRIEKATKLLRTRLVGFPEGIERQWGEFQKVGQNP